MTLEKSFVGDKLEAIIDKMRETPGDESLPPYFMYGHRQEIATRLLRMDKDVVNSDRKYPLFALRMDIPERVYNGIAHYSLNIVIATYTDRNYDAHDRMANVIKPILYPLYDQFFALLKQSGQFFWETTKDNEYPEHVAIDRPYWGTPSTEGNTANIFNDPIDAIEIVDLKINSFIKPNCF